MTEERGPFQKIWAKNGLVFQILWDSQYPIGKLETFSMKFTTKAVLFTLHLYIFRFFIKVHNDCWCLQFFTLIFTYLYIVCCHSVWPIPVIHPQYHFFAFVYSKVYIVQCIELPFRHEKVAVCPKMLSAAPPTHPLTDVHVLSASAQSVHCAWMDRRFSVSLDLWNVLC